jgi:glycerol uptake facilitator-like aquaporin
VTGGRGLIGEGLGTGLLLYIVVGSGIAAESLGSDPGTQLFTHAVVVGLGLAVLIALFQTVSGSHFNPAVTIAFWRTRAIDGGRAARYVAIQLVGALAGVVAAHVTFGLPPLSLAATGRAGWRLALAEGVATFTLVLIIFALVRTGRSTAVPAAVGAWVATVVFATSSTGFANPAVTVARMVTDSYTGIAPTSVTGFLVAQVVAGLLAAALAPALYPAHQSTST